MARQNITGKTVVITGASGGIGAATARAFARRGARLMLSGRNLEALEQAAAGAREAGGEARIFPADVTDRQAMQELINEAVKSFGSLDVVMLGAGYGLLGEVADVSLDDWQRLIDTNLFGALHGFYAALPRFIEQGHGGFIIMNSLSGRVAMGLSAPYCASKFALWGFVDSARCELREKNIGLLAVYPYFVKTSFQANIQSPDFHVAPDLAAKMWGQSPERLGEKIVRACERGKGELLCTPLGMIGPRLMPLSYHFAESFRRLILPITRKVLRGKGAERGARS